MDESAPHSMLVYFGLLIIVVTMHGVSQMLYKMGARDVQFSDFFRTIILNAPVISGYFISFAASLLYIYVIKHVPLSTAFPTTVLLQMFVLLGAYFFFGEPISVYKWIGFSLLMAGLYFIWK